MEVAFGADRINPQWESSVVCLGTFDGVHLGHQQVIRAAVERARQREVPCVLVTFDRHPAAVLAPDRCPPSVQGLSQNLIQFAKLGVSAAAVLTFDQALAETKASAFYEHVLKHRLWADCIVVGHDFAFGYGREGTPEWLKARIETQVVPPFLLDGLRVSSSVIRNAVANGEMDVANRLLGRPFTLEGTVVAGQKLGRTLGYPTLNLAQMVPTVLPGDGVYAGKWGDSLAAISVGMRPAVGGQHRTVEAYLLDYQGPTLYATSGRLEFFTKLRDEENFASLEALTKQIALDVESVRAHFHAGTPRG